MALKLDAEKEAETAKKHRVMAYPTMLFVKPDGTELGRIVGFRDAETFLKEAGDLLAGKSRIDKFPKHPVAQDFEHLADRLLSLHQGTPAPEQSRESGSLLKALFGRKAISEA